MYIEVHNADCLQSLAKRTTACFDTESTHYGLFEDSPYLIDYMLRDGIGLRAYGQKDPLTEYKREAFELFQRLMW